ACRAFGVRSAAVIDPAPAALAALPDGREIAVTDPVGAPTCDGVPPPPALARDEAVRRRPADGLRRVLAVGQEVARPYRLRREHDGVMIGIFAKRGPLADLPGVGREGALDVERGHDGSGSKQKRGDHSSSGSARPARRCAATRVLRISMAMVIGPTPPGTGVMAAATSAASS